MNLLYLIVALVAAQRLIELGIASRNTKWLLTHGGQEFGRRHYPLFVVLHAGWLLAVAVFIEADAPINPWWLILFLLLQAGRIWVITTLGHYWTTRIITLPEAPLVSRGPYRFCRHPNYVIVVGEIATLPLTFGAWELALIFSLLNGVLLIHRVKVENCALRSRRKFEPDISLDSGDPNKDAVPSEESREQ